MADFPLKMYVHSPKQHLAVQDHAIGRALRQRAAAVLLGHGRCKTLFIHAGLSPQVLEALLKQPKTLQSSTALLQQLNSLIEGRVQLS